MLLPQYERLDYVHHIETNQPLRLEAYLHAALWPARVGRELFRLTQDHLQQLKAVAEVTYPGYKVPNAVRNLRLAAGLSIKELSARSGVAYPTLLNADGGGPLSAATMVALSRTFGVTLNGLFRKSS